MLHSNIRRVAIRPGVTEVNNQVAGAAAQPTHMVHASTLSPNPHTLYILWEEYGNGIGGHKVASLFTREERGRSKHKYHRRKVFWDCISFLVRCDFTAQVPIDRIYTVYGVNIPVTRIINQLKVDPRTSHLHPLLHL